MRVLIACEFSGIVREAFRARGHFAYSCDLLSTERPGPHFRMDVLKILDGGWDLMIAHPPCTHLCVRGTWHCKRRGDEWKIDEAAEFSLALANAPVARIAIENPVGVMSTRWRKPDQYIEPYWFGDGEKKKTGLWLKSLPPLVPRNHPIYPKPLPAFVDRNGHARYFTDSFAPSKTRAAGRAKTFQGIANAMAEQWG